MHYVYILYNLDEQSRRNFYLGVTSNLERRVIEHQTGLSNFTSKFGPWKLVYYEAYSSSEDAIRREQQLKHHGKGFSELKKRIVKSIDEIKKVRDN